MTLDKKFSCETQLISGITDWAKSINHHAQTDAILFYFSKALDSELLWYSRQIIRMDYNLSRQFLNSQELSGGEVWGREEKSHSLHATGTGNTKAC